MLGRESSDIESQIESCLAYHVLRDPEKWIGAPRASYLQALLVGASTRADQTATPFEHWRIHGVLEDREFYSRLVAATGHPSLTIRWATAIELIHFSSSEGCAELLRQALAWHREHGIKEDAASIGWPADTEHEKFWHAFAERPAMYMGTNSGWDLYCFLTGLTEGGDWLGLPEIPLNKKVFDSITQRSIEAYGSKFGAFRVYEDDVSSLLGWAGYSRRQIKS